MLFDLVASHGPAVRIQECTRLSRLYVALQRGKALDSPATHVL